MWQCSAQARLIAASVSPNWPVVLRRWWPVTAVSRHTSHVTCHMSRSVTLSRVVCGRQDWPLATVYRDQRGAQSACHRRAAALHTGRHADPECEELSWVRLHSQPPPSNSAKAPAINSLQLTYFKAEILPDTSTRPVEVLTKKSFIITGWALSKLGYNRL